MKNINNNLLDLDSLSKKQIENILSSAKNMEDIFYNKSKNTLSIPNKTIAGLFFEPSTRTRISFEHASNLLGIKYIDLSLNDSSIKKGESLLNTALTLQAMKVDGLVLRHPHSGAPYSLLGKINTPIINAGDGTHAHPCQALTDLYTAKKHFGKIQGLSILIVGDILYSRVARSNILGFSKLGAKVKICAPATLLPQSLLTSNTNGIHSKISVFTDLQEAMVNSNIVMPLRIQKERQIKGHLPYFSEYNSIYGINNKILELANSNVMVMHPGPMNEGVEIDPVVAHGEKSLIEKQVENGISVKMAILHKILT